MRRSRIENVRIFSIGSCSTQTRIGVSQVLLQSANDSELVRFNYSGTTSKRCVIQALIDGVKMLANPKKVALITSTPLA